MFLEGAGLLRDGGRSHERECRDQHVVACDHGSRGFGLERVYVGTLGAIYRKAKTGLKPSICKYLLSQQPTRKLTLWQKANPSQLRGKSQQSFEPKLGGIHPPIFGSADRPIFML